MKDEKPQELSDEGKQHVEESFSSLMDAHGKGKLAFAAALKKHLKNLDPGAGLEKTSEGEGE